MLHVMLCLLLCILKFVLFKECVQCQIWLYSVVVPSCYSDQLTSVSLWVGSSCPSYYWYHFCFYFCSSIV